MVFGFAKFPNIHEEKGLQKEHVHRELELVSDEFIPVELVHANG